MPSRVAVITPYYKEELSILRACHESVLAQTFPCLHVLIADGEPLLEVDAWQAHHIKLPFNHNDIGSTPRLIGSYHAIGLGVDAVSFLDADNWYSPDHIGSMMNAMDSEKLAFVTSSRMLHRLDGTTMAPCPITDPVKFIDTNCMLFGRQAFHLLHHWALMPKYGHLIGDRIILHHLNQSHLAKRHLDNPTVGYRCKREGLYKHFNEAIPHGVLPRPNYESSFKRWVEDGNPPLP